MWTSSGEHRTLFHTVHRHCRQMAALAHLHFSRTSLEDRFLYSAGTDSLENFTAEFPASTPVVYKIPPPVSPEFLYTTVAGWCIKSCLRLLMPLFLMGCFPVHLQDGKRPLKTKSGKRPIKARIRPIKEGKRPVKAMVLVGISGGCLMGCFRAPPPWRKTAPLKRPMKRSMNYILTLLNDVAIALASYRVGKRSKSRK